MIGRLWRWLWNWRQRAAAKRFAQRYTDMMMLWERLWEEAEHEPTWFITLASRRTAKHWAWRYPKEWQHTLVDPGVWAARKFKEARPLKVVR